MLISRFLGVSRDFECFVGVYVFVGVCGSTGYIPSAAKNAAGTKNAAGKSKLRETSEKRRMNKRLITHIRGPKNELIIAATRK
jgi:hypothetical protein